MKISLEEAFKYLSEDDETNDSAKTADDITFVPSNDNIEIVDDPDPVIEIPDVDPKPLQDEVDQLTKDFKEAKKWKTNAAIGIPREVPEKIIIDLWDQVYCSLTDGSDNRVYEILKPELRKKYYPITHVAPSTSFTGKLPVGFKRKPGFNDIIVISPQIDIDDPFDDNDPSDDELSAIERRNKKNRKLDFDYARKVADAYDGVLTEELPIAFVFYIPRVSYLDVENLDPNPEKVLKLFPDHFIDTYLNNTNLRYKENGKLKLTYPLNAYYREKMGQNKAKKLAFIEANEDLKNWVDDTAEEIFYDTFGVKKTDGFTSAEEHLFNALREKVLNETPIFIDNALEGHDFVKNNPGCVEELRAKEEDLLKRVEEFNAVLYPLIKECAKIKDRQKRVDTLTALENKLIEYKKFPKLPQE